MKTLRQGDWTFSPIRQVLKEARKITLKDNKFTFAEGEQTGHFHTLVVPTVDDMEFYKLADGSYIVKVKKEGYATHPEHSTKHDLVVPVGTYHLKQRREKDWFSLAVRRVVD